MRFLKYNIPTLNWESLKQTISNEWGYIDCSVVIVGDISLIGSQINNEPIGILAIDILWNNDEAVGFEEYRVYPNPCGVHTFSGAEYLYEIEYNIHMT